MKTISTFSIIVLTLLVYGCNKSSTSPDHACIKGMVLGLSCQSVFIQVNESNPIGASLKDPATGEVYSNAVLASIDLIHTGMSMTPDTNLFRRNAVIYFEYKSGGSPRSEYIKCVTEPSITITALSDTPCH